MKKTEPLRLGILGVSGRMGYWVSLLAKENPKKFKLTYTPLKNEPLDGFYDCDVVIDFSSADAVCNFIKNSETKTNRGKSQPALVIGSTGWSPEQNKLLKKYSTRTAVAVSSNFSIGVLVLREVLKSAGPLLKNLGYTPVMLERHHEHKKDAPSGTAIMLNQVIGEISNSRIQTHSVRSKEIIGDHQITFYGSADYLQFEHHAQDRSIFARGALEFATWIGLKKKKNVHLTGTFGPDDFLKTYII